MAETPAVEIPRDHLRTPGSWRPRVRPRVAIEDLVSREAHPPRRKIETDGQADDRLHWTSIVAIVAIFTFWAASTVAGIVAVWSWRGAMAALGLAVSSLVVSWRIEAE